MNRMAQSDSITEAAEDLPQHGRTASDANKTHKRAYGRLSFRRVSSIICAALLLPAALLAQTDLATALNTTGLTWHTIGNDGTANTGWKSQTAVSRDGRAAGFTIEGESAELWTTVQGPGVLTFWWRKGNDSDLQFDLLDQTGAIIDSRYWGYWVDPPIGGTTWVQETVVVRNNRVYEPHWYGYVSGGGVYLDNVVWTPLASVSLAEALDTPNLTWEAEEHWWGYGVNGFKTTTFSHDGVDAAVMCDGAGRLSTTVSGPGVFKFWHRSTYNTPYYYLYLEVYKGSDYNDSDSCYFAQSSAWQQSTVTVTGAGEHTIAFLLDGGSDVWIDQVTWTGAVPLIASFNGNSGTPATQTVTQTVGSKYVLPSTNPTRTSYTFAGWWTTSAASGGSQVTTATTVTQSSAHTLYARWTATPTHDFGFYKPNAWGDSFFLSNTSTGKTPVTTFEQGQTIYLTYALIDNNDQNH